MKMDIGNTICGIRFWTDRDNEIKDVTGCLKESGHQRPHVCKDHRGVFIEWDYDYDCKCGCWDTDNFNDVCGVYREVKSIK